MIDSKKVRLSIEIEEYDHKYLKMCCLKMGVSIKEFVLNAVIEKVDSHEDDWMIKRWEEDGTREEIEKEKIDHSRKVYEVIKENGEDVIVAIPYSEIIEKRKMELMNAL